MPSQTHATLSSAQQVQIYLNPRGRIAAWSREAQTLYGFDDVEAVDRQFHLALGTADEYGRIQDFLSAANRNGEAFIECWQQQRDNGKLSRFRAEIAGHAFHDSFGQLAGIALTVLPAASMLGAARVRELREFLDLFSGPALILNGECQVCVTNDNFCGQFQLEPAEIEGLNFFEVFSHAFDIPEIRARIDRLLSADELFTNVLLEHTFPRIGALLFSVSARRLPSLGPRMVLIYFEIGGRRRRRTGTDVQSAGVGHPLTGADYLALADALPQAIWASTPEGHLDYHNRRWDYISERVSELICGWEWIKLLHPDDRDITVRNWKYCLESGEHWEAEFRLRQRDDSYRWYLTRARPVFVDNRIVRWVGTCTDIHDQKMSEQWLRLIAKSGSVLTSSLDLEATLRNTLQAIVPDFADCCLIDLLDKNDKLEAAGGLHVDPKKHELIRVMRQRYPIGPDAKHGPHAVVRTGEPDWCEDVAEGLLKSVAFNEEHLNMLKSLEPESYMVLPLSAKGRTIGAISFISTSPWRHYRLRDVEFAQELARQISTAVENARLYSTGQKELAERKRVESALAEADRRKDEFLATLAHELRNPLAPIRNAVHLMQRPNCDKEALQHTTEIIERQVSHMVRLIDDLLDVSRIQRGKLQLRMERREIWSIVEEAVDAARPLIETRGHRLHVERPAEPIWVAADPTRLEQIVVNLLSNAARYTQPGGNIHLKVAATDDMAQISVLDSGIGIPPEMLSRIFDLFTQVDKSMEKTSGGLGIGLTLVRYLVQMHGGTVEARSNGLGQGSEFIVHLPRIATMAQVPEEPKIVPSFAAAEPRHILLIEDNEDSRETLSLVLREWGHKVDVEGDGAAGVETGLRVRPQIALVDLGLPKMSGFEVARHLRDGLGADIYLVALTGFGQPEDRRKALEAGFNAHMVKPADLCDLAQLINNAPVRK